MSEKRSLKTGRREERGEEKGWKRGGRISKKRDGEKKVTGRGGGAGDEWREGVGRGGRRVRVGH